jgi:hypothetical protein
MSWTRASVQPPNQPRMTSYAALASLFVVDISTVWTMLRRDCFLRAGALNCCTAEELPSGIGEPGRLAGHQDPGLGLSGAGLAPAAGEPRS